MKNQWFDLVFDKESGGIVSIKNCNDTHAMNWCSEDSPWGLIRCTKRDSVYGLGRDNRKEMQLVRFEEKTDGAISVYSNDMVSVTVTRSFAESGNLVEEFTVTNIQDQDVFLGQDNFGIVVPLNDRYTSADQCMTQNCNAHIWCGKNITYVNALKMGPSEYNLGLVLTKGSMDSYRVDGCCSNNRGIFTLNSSFFTLEPGESHSIAWELFWHKGKEDFQALMQAYPGMIWVDAKHYTLFEGEEISFSVSGCVQLESLQIVCRGRELPFCLKDGKGVVAYKPEEKGIYRFEISCGEITTYAEFLVTEPLETLVEKRLDFIVEKQQFLKESSSLYGAFLIYDNRDGHMVFDGEINDHNACRERVGMGILLAKYLQTHQNKNYEKALSLYLEFIKREIYDEETGEVFDHIHRKNKRIRLYNAPWIMMLFAEVYLLTGDCYYTNQIVKIADWFYNNDGGRFYPNAVSFHKLISVLKQDNHKETDRVLEMFRKHADYMVALGTAYPKHEVNYEQTIVAPAATLVGGMGLLTGEEQYTRAAGKHIEVLERFDGNQPSYFLNEIPIRYWDDFWFGKGLCFGDTFPHYWSCLTADSFYVYYRLTQDARYLEKCEACIRNCLCLFNEKGEGSAAHVYPYRVNDKAGQFYDDWANDQDFALYYALELLR